MARVRSRLPGRRVTGIDEIKSIAMRQVTDGGPEALSLNAIARELDITGPALYRYVAGRDDLATLLLVDAFADFAATLESAGRSRRPDLRLRAAARAYRSWAAVNPNRYRLVMGPPLHGEHIPDEVLEGGQAAFAVLVGLVAGLLPGAGSRRSIAAAARAWARIHGFVSLELAGHLGVLGLPADALFAKEIDAFIAELAGPARRR